MTYLLGYKGESEKMKLDTDIDTCDFISELFLYIEKERYEMRYCLYSNIFAEKMMSINIDFLEQYGLNLQEYAILKLGGLDNLLELILEEIKDLDYINKEEITTILEKILEEQGGIKNPKTLTPEVIAQIKQEDIEEEYTNEPEDNEDNEDTEQESSNRTSPDELLANISSEVEEELEQTMNGINKEDLDGGAGIIYDLEGGEAFADILFHGANNIYKLFTEIYYSKEGERIDPTNIYRQIRRYHPSHETAYLDWRLSKNFLDHRQVEIKKKDKDLHTQIDHNNYHKEKLDILYNIFKTKYCIENELLPSSVLERGGVLDFRNYEDTISGEQKEFREKRFNSAISELDKKFKLKHLREKDVIKDIRIYEKTATEKFSQSK